MHKKLFSSFLILLAISTAAPVLAANSGAIIVPLNRSQLVSLPQDVSEVIISDPNIADVHVHSARNVSLIGKAVGTTNVKFFDKDANVVREADVVVSYDLPAIRKTLKEFLPTERVAIELVNTNIALTGEVSNASAADTALKIVREFVSPGGAAGGEDGPQILNFMKVVSGQQVMLRVRVGEVQRTALKELGFGLTAEAGDAFFGSGSGLVGVGTGNFGNVSMGGNTFGALGGNVSFGNLNVAGYLQTLERDGLFKVLAEPNLVSSSGEKAQFLAGGEFPIPKAEDGQVTIEFKPYGIAVQFVPYVLTENKIRLSVQPEVSELSDEGSVEISGFKVPGIITRRASTTVELAPGESFMIAGLISDKMRSTIDSIPGAKEVPILSSLFRSTAFQRNETELVIAVTPYIVDPLKSADVRLPTDNFAAASLMDSVFYGSLGSATKEERTLSQTPPLEGPIGFMVD